MDSDHPWNGQISLQARSVDKGHHTEREKNQTAMGTGLVPLPNTKHRTDHHHESQTCRRRGYRRGSRSGVVCVIFPAAAK